METVLVAEDDTIQRDLLVRAMAKYAQRFQVIAVSDGEKAIQAIQQTPIDLLITDIYMPRINGLVLLAYVNTYHPRIPCFVITAYGTSRLQAKMPRDVLRFFHKPIIPQDLAQAVVLALDRCKKENPEKGISVVSFLKLIDMEQMTCRFEVTTSQGQSGFMRFDNGALCDARYGELEGEAAALGLIAAQMGTYRFTSVGDSTSCRIQTDLDQLVRNVFAAKDIETPTVAEPLCQEKKAN